VVTGESLVWRQFECDGRLLEYAVVPAAQVERVPGPRPRKRSVPIVMVTVRKPGTDVGPAIVYPAGTQATAEHAMEVARMFWAQLG
jgi:hypothetical protein